MNSTLRLAGSREFGLWRDLRVVISFWGPWRLVLSRADQQADTEQVDACGPERLRMVGPVICKTPAQCRRLQHWRGRLLARHPGLTHAQRADHAACAQQDFVHKGFVRAQELSVPPGVQTCPMARRRLLSKCHLSKKEKQPITKRGPGTASAAPGDTSADT